MRQHALGRIRSTRLIAQGVPQTAGSTPAPGSYGPVDWHPDATSADGTTAAPGGCSKLRPSAPARRWPAIATYDPLTGKFVAPDGAVLRQSNLAQNGGAASLDRFDADMRTMRILVTVLTACAGPGNSVARER